MRVHARRTAMQVVAVCTLILALGMPIPASAQAGGSQTLVGGQTVAWSAAAQSIPPPTVSEIMVDDYDCDTGLLEFHVFVTNLPSVPDGTDPEGPLRRSFPLHTYFDASYSVGLRIVETGVPKVYSPTEAQSPYSGRVDLARYVPPTNIDAPGNEPTGGITSVELYVNVGYPVYEPFSALDARDGSTLTYDVDCDGGGGDTSDLIRQLVAILIQILQSLPS